MKCLEHNNRAVILATVTPLTFLILSIFFFDIPLATWIDSYWMVRFPVIGKPDIPDILLITVVILTILSWTGYLYLSRLNIYDQRTFACRVMGTILPISYGVKIILKWVFGRTDVRTWLADPSLHGFHWFAGTEDAQSFPSGHMLVFAPLFMVMWQLYPKHRVYCGIIWFSLGAALILTEYHFLSDVLAGAYVGICLYQYVRTLLDKKIYKTTPRN